MTTTNLAATVAITLVTNQMASVMPTTDHRFDTYITNQRHIIAYTNGAQVFLITNDYQVVVERRKFIAVRTVHWKEVLMPASTAPAPPLPGATNNFGSVNQ